MKMSVLSLAAVLALGPESAAQGGQESRGLGGVAEAEGEEGFLQVLPHRAI